MDGMMIPARPSASPRFLLHMTLALGLVLTLTPASAQADQGDEAVALKFCVDILRQSKYDAAQCLLKPHGFRIPGKDPAVLTYLCCLGYFRDVTHNYTPYMAKDLVMYIASVQTASDGLISLGTFVGQCSRVSRLKSKISLKDFNYWSRNGGTIRACKAPRK